MCVCFFSSDPTLMTAPRVAAAVVAEGGDADEVKVLIADPGAEDEHDSCFVSSVLNSLCLYLCYIFSPLL